MTRVLYGGRGGGKAALLKKWYEFVATNRVRKGDVVWFNDIPHRVVLTSPLNPIRVKRQRREARHQRSIK